MSIPVSSESPAIRFTDKFSDAINQLERAIRERAYQLYLDRHPDQVDSMADWLEAKAELVTPVQIAVNEQKKNVVVECVLKDFSPEEIEIEVIGDVLKVLGSHNETTSNTEGHASESTTNTLSFFQSTHLPAAVDVDNSHAKLFKNGKLKITLPKKPVEKP